MSARADEIVQESGLPIYDAMQIAAADTLSRQSRSISIPKRFSIPMRDIWLLQLRLQQTHPRRALRLLSHPKFRAGYDFLLLRGKVENNKELIELGKFWTDYQKQNPNEVQASGTKPKSARRPRKRGPNRRTSGPSTGGSTGNNG